MYYLKSFGYYVIVVWCGKNECVTQTRVQPEAAKKFFVIAENSLIAHKKSVQYIVRVYYYVVFFATLAQCSLVWVLQITYLLLYKPYRIFLRLPEKSTNILVFLKTGFRPPGVFETTQYAGALPVYDISLCTFTRENGGWLFGQVG